jgi:tungstate transport system substrate-binding protein
MKSILLAVVAVVTVIALPACAASHRAAPARAPAPASALRQASEQAPPPKEATAKESTARALALPAGPAAPAAPVTPEVILATTTSTQDTGLLDVLLPVFERQTGYRVKPIAVGTGQALALGARGEADVVLVHAPDSERTWMAEGNGASRLLVMHNDFVLTGPASDPAGVKGRTDAQAAFAQIARAGALFVSRGDNSGTHQAELAIWRAARVEPRGKSWYQESGQGMGATLNIADEKRAYTLTDRSTYLARRSTLQLRVLVAGSPELLNVYHVMPVSQARFPRVNAPGGQAFASFMTSREAQNAIAAYGRDRYGEPLFFADAGKPDN